MSDNLNTLIGFSICLLLASFICAPTLGITGIVSAIVAIYFGIVFVNSAEAAANRKNRRRDRR